MKVRKLPVEVEAEFVDYDKPYKMSDEFRAQLCECQALPNAWPSRRHVHTLEGPVAVRDGCWLVKGVAGEFYPVDPSVFAAAYERIAEPS